MGERESDDFTDIDNAIHRDDTCTTENSYTETHTEHHTTQMEGIHSRESEHIPEPKTVRVGVVIVSCLFTFSAAFIIGFVLRGFSASCNCENEGRNSDYLQGNVSQTLSQNESIMSSTGNYTCPSGIISSPSILNTEHSETVSSVIATVTITSTLTTVQSCSFDSTTLCPSSPVLCPSLANSDPSIVTSIITSTVVPECSYPNSITSTPMISPTPSMPFGTSTSTVRENTTQCRQCSKRDPVLSKNVTRLSPFAPLSREESRMAIDVMKIRNYSTFTQNFDENRISHVYLFPPNKQATLEYLDNGGPFPGRYARVHIVRPRAIPPDVVEYKVGPLNETRDNLVVEQVVADGTIAFNRRPSENKEERRIADVLNPQIQILDPLLKESFDNASFNKEIFAYPIRLTSVDINDRLSHIMLYLYVSELATTLRIVPVSCILHHPGINISSWYTSDWVYNSQGTYDSSEELLAAYNRGDLEKLTFPNGYIKSRDKELNPVRNTTLPPREFADKPPPRTYEQKGARYSIEGSVISWMGWELEFSSNAVRGPGLFNVKFLQQRIAYEISLQDITLIYHPYTNGHGPLAISDVSDLVGLFDNPKPDLDCPQRGIILNVTIFFEGNPVEIRAACVFEADGQKSLWRHYNFGLSEHYLVIRTVSTIGNYDYTVEWNFHLDGHVDTAITASGYLYGEFNGGSRDATTPFGNRILDFTSGPIHDHSYAFKMDLDILGTNNSFQNVNWKAGKSRVPYNSYTNSSEKPPYVYFNNTRYIEREILERETAQRLDADNPTFWTVINENENNIWGVPRGYRVVPHSLHNEILTEHPLLKGYEHLKNRLSISKRKDTEQHIADSLYLITHPEIPLPSINSMIMDNENIRDDDIVLWINEKFYHHPSSEDIPMTMAVRSGFTLKPFNYFDRSPVFDLPAFYLDAENPYEYEPCYENS